ncbi:hypothetical protein ABIB57_003613 [Devosia sp. UYZn731]
MRNSGPQTWGGSYENSICRRRDVQLRRTRSRRDCHTGVKEAYGRPQMSVESNKAKSVTEFRNDMELACYTGK